MQNSVQEKSLFIFPANPPYALETERMEPECKQAIQLGHLFVRWRGG